MTLFQVEFLTEDIELRDLCSAYWQADEKGKFTHKVSELAERFNIKSHEVPSVVSKHCRAFRTDMLCEKCGQPVKYLNSSRSYVSIDRRQRDWQRDWQRDCDNCQRDIREQEAEIERQQAEILKEEKEEDMREAFEKGLYESLNLLEFNFLVALATSENTNVARKKVGLSEKDAKSILVKFNKLHLINHGVGISGYALLDELHSALQHIGLQRSVKAIFGSPKALDLYRKLKREYLFVFPEIPLCAFIDKTQVEHLFTESWHAMYFLTARLDFVVCDPEGKPILAFEYQGGYHKSSDQAVKDIFKKDILNEVGLPLREITSQDLQNPDKDL